MSKLHQKLTLIMQFLLVEHYLQIWLPVESAMILIVIYSHRLAITMVALKVTELVHMAIKTHVLELAENVYC
nr:MAG TPA: hypothetical protein [Bacteriophage sp.]